MKFEMNYFNSVIFFRSLHHFQDVDLLLKYVYDILKKGGNLLVCEPVRKNFSKKSSEFAAIMRVISPTWEPYTKKLKGLNNIDAWNEYLAAIYDEYTFKNKYEQSPFDNSTNSLDYILETIKKHFTIKTIEFSDAFIDKLIGGLRGENKFLIAKFLKFLDEYLINTNTLPPTSFRLHAIKL